MNHIPYILSLTIGAATLLSTQSCYSDNEEDMYAIETCDTTNFSFSKGVKPILDRHCVRCHSSSNKENFSLEGYENVKAAGVQTIFLSINHSPEVLPMPEDSPKLSDCKIKTIEKWIKEGAKND